ncbi:MAG: hypothetical protein ACLPXB_00440 [Thiobacillaceae bacterium]
MNERHLITPYGGELTNLVVPPDRAEWLRKESFGLRSIDLDWRQLCELEMLLNGA